VKPIEQLRKHIKTRHPQAALTLTSPLNKEGVWYIDLTYGDKRLAIEWSLGTGFGVSSLPSDSYGERPDETYKSVEDAQRRISELLTTNEHTSPPIGVMLSHLREQRGYTQEELASKLNVRQATISGIERRDDIQFSTLCRVIKALRGSLEMFVVFADGRYRLTPASIDFSIDTLSLSEPRTRISAFVSAEATEAFDYDLRFEALRECGELSWARKIANDISARGSVFEMAD